MDTIRMMLLSRRARRDRRFFERRRRGSHRRFASRSADENAIRTEYRTLQSDLLRHDRLYYEMATPAVTDEEYDQLARRAEDIEKRFPDLVDASSRSNRIGSGRAGTEAILKRQHADLVLSLTNSYDTKRAIKLVETVPEFGLAVEPKIDGVSVSIRYDGDGRYVHAATRGDGRIGEDVSRAIEIMNDVPKSISLRGVNCDISSIEIRGELYLPKEALSALNASTGDDVESSVMMFAHSRNATAGTLRKAQSGDPGIVSRRGLRFAAYSVTATTPSETIAKLESVLGVQSQIDLLEFLRDRWAFSIPDPCMQCNDAIDVEEVVKSYRSIRGDMPHDIDGVVFKVNCLRTQREMGRSSRAPRWATAFKFPAQTTRSRVLNVSVQVSRFGVLTPVAELEPVTIGGANVRRATLHNWAEIARLGLKIGSSVMVARAGDVIPRIESVVEDESNDDSVVRDNIRPPTECPACSSPVVANKDGESGADGPTMVRCTASFSCAAQIEARLAHFTGRSGLAIPGLGGKSISFLHHQMKLIESPADIFDLRVTNAAREPENRLENQRGWGEKSAEKLFSAIENRLSDGVHLSELIRALGIPSVGKSTAVKMAQAVDNDPERWWAECTKLGAVEHASDVDGPFSSLGDAIVRDISTFFSDTKNRSVCSGVLGSLQTRRAIAM